MADAAPSPAPAPGPAPSPAPGPAPSPAPAAPAASAAPAEFSWANAGLDADSLNYVTTKGFKDIPAVVHSYKNAEKLLGVPAEHVIKLPTGDNPDFGPVYDRLGRPKAAADYALPMPKEGGDKAFAETAGKWFHEAGLSTKQAQAIAGKWNEYAAGVSKAAADARAAAHAAEVTTLKGEWGADYDKNIGFVDRAINAFGLDAKTLTAMKDAIGPAAALKLFHNIGTKLGTDDNFIAGNGKGGWSGGETAEQASAKKAELMQDKAWVAKYNAGDIEARREMQRLNRIIAPGVVTF